MASKKVVFVRGKLYWAKIIGDPRPNYGGDAREWTFEFEPDEEGLATFKENKITDRLKDKYEDRGKYITLRKPEFNKEGEPNRPIRVLKQDGTTEWGTDLLGNGTVADVKLDIRDYGPGKKLGIYPVAIRIVDHVEYASNEFAPLEEVAPKAGKAKAKDTFKEDFGLDDDVDEVIPA